MKIALTSVFVHDPIAAHESYTEVLGFESHLYAPEYALAIIVSPEEPGGTGLLLEPNGNPIAGAYQSGIYESGLPAIVFGVEAHLEDTCGNLIQLHQAL